MDLCLKLPLVLYVIVANREGFGMTVRMTGSPEPSLFSYVVLISFYHMTLRLRVL